MTTIKMTATAIATSHYIISFFTALHLYFFIFLFKYLLYHFENRYHTTISTIEVTRRAGETKNPIISYPTSDIEEIIINFATTSMRRYTLALILDSAAMTLTTDVGVKGSASIINANVNPRSSTNLSSRSSFSLLWIY